MVAGSTFPPPGAEDVPTGQTVAVSCVTGKEYESHIDDYQDTLRLIAQEDNYAIKEVVNNAASKFQSEQE
jgi:hypothetical protein